MLSKLRIIASLLLVVLLAACGGSADVAPEETGAPETEPAAPPTDAAPETPTDGEPTATEMATTEPATEEAGEMRDVTLGLSTSSTFGYGYWIASNLGFYEEDGLNVDLQATGGSSDVAQLLAANNIEAGMGVPGAMLPVIERGVPLYPFFTYAYGAVFDVVVPADSDVSSVAELEGMTIGISELAGGEVPLLRALLAEEGIDPDADVQIIEVGAAAPNVQLSLEQGQIDAYAGANSDIATFQAVGLDVTSVVPEELENLPAEGLLAPEENRDDAELLVGLGRGTAKGQLIAYTNQDAAVCVLMEEIPEQFTDEEAGRESLAATIEGTTAPQEDGEYVFGYLDAQGWNTYVDIFQQADVITEDIDMSQYVIDDHLEAINDFDQDAIVDMANELPTDC